MKATLSGHGLNREIERLSRSGKAEFIFEDLDVLEWNAEYPILYDLYIETPGSCIKERTGFKRVEIEISALTPSRPVGSWKEIEIGRHGMTITLNGRSAVFLPQVATEQGWNLEETLTSLSRKAGLAPDAWKSPEAKFTVFEAIVFRESDFRETGR